MRLAVARAGLWFFGTFIGTFFLLYEYLEKYSMTKTLAVLTLVAFVVAGTIFFYTWYDYEKKKNG